MRRILILHTGGTFGMVPQKPRPTLAPAEVQEHILTHVPELERIAHIDFRMVCNLDSADMQIRHWQALGQTIAGALPRYEGFVIIHGTDSMAYTAAALSFMLRNLPKPVILTGSQRPLVEIRTDARFNLINAVELATHPIPEVGIFFGTHLYRGNRTIKVSTTEYGAFDSPNFPPLAEVGVDIRLSDHHLYPTGEFQLLDQFSDAVLAVRFFPGLDPGHLDFLVESPVQALVIEGLGMGNLAVQEKSLVPLVERMTDAGKLVVITSQCTHGMVDLTRYENGNVLLSAGAFGAGDMTTEATIVKLMHLLAYHGEDMEEVRRRLLSPIAGEVGG